MNQHLTTSLIIPVYNDEEALLTCLKLIEQLETRPDEVIVIDNNSSDGSGLVAESFPWVKLLSEPKRGVVHPRTLGYNEARGDLIVRIDSDSQLPKDWLTKVIKYFSKHRDVAAVSGSMIYYDFYLTNFSHWLDKQARSFAAKHMKGHIFLNGSNMVMRQTAWDKVKKELCECVGTHEDLDLAIHLQDAGLKVDYIETLIAGISARRFASGFRKFVKYCLVSPKTYAEHHLLCRLYMYPIIFVLCALYLPAHLIYLSYDQDRDVLSWRYFWTNRLRESRVEPYVNAA